LSRGKTSFQKNKRLGAPGGKYDVGPTERKGLGIPENKGNLGASPKENKVLECHKDDRTKESQAPLFGYWA